MHTIETLILVGYLDQIFSEAGPREVTPLRTRTMPETLNRLHADAMRNHARANALLAQENGRWNATPDWRLDRQIIRLGLYLRERLGVESGQRVALLSELRPEWLIADLASVGLGAISVAIDSRLEGDELAAALEDAAPSITVASSASQRRLQSLDGRAPAHGRVIALDSPAAGDGILRFRELLEMGGTLDTPERAQAFRAGARDVAADQPAIRHYTRATGGGWDRLDLTQGEVIQRLLAGWLRERARPEDLAYVSDPATSLAARLALYAFLGDGYTTTALAPVGGGLSDLAALHPTTIVASPGLLAEAVRAGAARADQPPGSNGRWLGFAARLVSLGRTRSDQGAIQDTLGGRVRRIGSTDLLDFTLTERLGGIDIVGAAPI
jgi:long-chain acyl-CoA synthetase